jgi:DNA-binding NarL/FixJ family response regulator
VLIDVRQPVFNDLQHLATIRRLSPQSAVVVMTAFGTREMRETALDLGAYCIVPKPFEVKDMVELVLEAYESSAGLPVGAR